MVVYVSSLLAKQQQRFFEALMTVLRDHDIELAQLQGTKDIWVRDYMPIQRSDGVFAAYTYAPDYLSKGYKHLITNWRLVRPLPVEMPGVESGLVLDGGNVLLNNRSAIVTEKIFAENPKIAHAGIEKRLKESLLLDSLVVIPSEKGDLFGHADGMVAWAGPDHVLLNDYRSLDRRFHEKVKGILIESGLVVTEIPYCPVSSRRQIPPAHGNYANLLVLPEIVLVPTYGLPEDEQAWQIIKDLFPANRVLKLDASGPAKEGGSIHCLTWEVTMRSE